MNQHTHTDRCPECNGIVAGRDYKRTRWHSSYPSLLDALPPDVEHAIQRHPQMLAIIRQAAAKLDQRKE